MTTVPGFSSRSTAAQIQQFPQRDEAIMSDYQPAPGFSNSEGVKDSGVTGTVDSSADAVQALVEEPGFSNGKAADAPVEASAVEEKPAKKTAAKKSTKKKS